MIWIALVNILASGICVVRTTDAAFEGRYISASIGFVLVVLNAACAVLIIIGIGK